jgi:signal transduction histidine kinase
LSSNFQADIETVGRVACVPEILDVVCRMTGMRLAAVARVTDDHWVALKVLDQLDFGLFPGSEMKPGATICSESRRLLQTLAVNRFDDDERFRLHPASALHRFQSYISTPIILEDGTVFGTLCAMDRKPAQVDNPATISTFRLFAELIARHLDADRAATLNEQRLMDERVAADLRERFIAILGHDLRNPLASIQAGTKRLGRLSDDEQIATTLSLMQRSIERLATLIDNAMDFARGQMHDGMELQRKADEPLEPVLTEIIDELRSGWPERQIEADFHLTRPVSADRRRLGQLVSNLVGNALAHGSDEGPIRVNASTRDHEFVLSVANPGLPIPADRLDRLFRPFNRDNSQGRSGLGLGLYVAAEIARAHRGEISVSSTAGETCFTFRMPIGNHES